MSTWHGPLNPFRVSPQSLLYVEDNAAEVALFYSALRHGGTKSFRLLLATGLEQAFDHFLMRRPRPTAVLLDYDFGNFGATDFLHWLRAQPDCGSVEVAVFIRPGNHGDIRQCYRAGCDYCLLKPAALAEFGRLVDALDRGYQTPAKHRVLYGLVGLPAYCPPDVSGSSC